MKRQILANFDEEGISVYQAFKPSTAEEALRLGTFGTGFSLDRMTWIKPSFGWMLYRSGYATKQGQECILKIKLTHEGFQTILAQAVPSSFDLRSCTSFNKRRSLGILVPSRRLGTRVGRLCLPAIENGARCEFDRTLFKTEKDWSAALRRSEVRYQWDPDRDLKLQILPHRALQLGIRGSAVRNYVNCWILGIEDVTELAHSIKTAIANQKQLPSVPEEKVYDVSPQIQKILRISL